MLVQQTCVHCGDLAHSQSATWSPGRRWAVVKRIAEPARQPGHISDIDQKTRASVADYAPPVSRDGIFGRVRVTCI
jgi:hypothetical protein